jgi:hypothetical protein
MEMYIQLQTTAALPPEKAPLRRNGKVEAQLREFLSTALDGDE